MLRDLPPLDSGASATGLCEPDLHVFAKLFEDRLERGLVGQKTVVAIAVRNASG